MFFSVSFFIGIVVGVVLSFTNESFYELLSSNKKMVFSIMNGTIDYLSLFWKVLFQFMFPLILLFVLNINYYIGKLSYLFIGGQSALMVISFSAIISSFGIFGIMNVVFILLPINLLYFLCLLYFAVICRERSKVGLFDKNMLSGLDNDFFSRVAIAMLMTIVVSVFASVVVPTLFKTFSFIIY